eukprot:CAMPEP_0174862776 /NCGR_PEP_ID=MMETSP1114-20130205/54852_1 /TAXON_ID=312471 /ORGANISM="Neobodo designis, Strain CCAP 1951/1" /LENGTH=311 /DNA_ID=CAMNT_0016097835 /DNA_START=42 /DNA_END=974 /DNA_ORIENTATION=+
MQFHSSHRGPAPSGSAADLGRRPTVVHVEHELRRVLADIESHCANPAQPLKQLLGEDDDDYDARAVCSVGSFRAERAPPSSARLRSRAQPRVHSARTPASAAATKRVAASATVRSAGDDDGVTVNRLLSCGVAEVTAAAGHSPRRSRCDGDATARQRLAQRVADGEVSTGDHRGDDPDVLRMCGAILGDDGESPRRDAQFMEKSKRAGDRLPAVGADRFRKSAYFCKPIRPVRPRTPPGMRPDTSRPLPRDPDELVAERVAALLSTPRAHHAATGAAPSSRPPTSGGAARQVRLPAAPVVTKRPSGRFKFS